MRLTKCLTLCETGGNEVLQNSGKVSAEEAKEHAETEFEKYRIIQDRLFQSDFKSDIFSCLLIFLIFFYVLFSFLGDE